MRGLSGRLRSVIDALVTRTTAESSGSIVVDIRHKSAPSTLTLSELLAALQLLDGDKANATFQINIRDRLTLDLLSHPFVVSHDAASVTFTLEARIPAQSPDAILAGLRAYAYALASSVPTQVTRDILDTVVDQAVKQFLPKHVPESSAGLQDFSSLFDQFQSLATDLANRSLVSPSSLSAISSFSPQEAFALHRQELILAQTRAKLLKVNPTQLEFIPCPALVDADTIARVTQHIQEINPSTTSPPVTLTSKSLLLTRADPLSLPASMPIPTYIHEFTQALIHEWSLATAANTTATDLSLVTSMLDMFLLHTRSTYLATVRRPVPPRSVALAHNACMCVADVVTRLCLTCAPTWHPAMARQIARTLQLAKDIVRAHVSVTKSDLVKLLAPLDPLWIDVVRNRDRVQAILLGVVERIKREADALKPVAPLSIRYYMLGAVYDAALHSLLNELYAWSDISAAESEELCSLLQTLLIPGHHFAAAPGAAAAAAAGELAWAPHYAAHHAVVELLNLSLREIMDRFRARRYAASLTVDQLTRLVVALFQDSDVRSGALAEMAGGVRLGLLLPGAAAAAAATGARQDR
ncbi:hypothetical protein BCR44DRAFT_1006666 [Catenaria anguillulae PL171]|uniref:ZW10 C-terminal helical domain-containing protein n=1 Tax=Catenaria anguillulae PL171 TaxID=765915 RepID=A0A1Y2I5U2_9FUNG|nr:hypothetical protein BCR44DRAFT_1006666 [Catenaria anguillulae PL171]